MSTPVNPYAAGFCQEKIGPDNRTCLKSHPCPEHDPPPRRWTPPAARVAVLEAQLTRIRDRVDALVDAGWLSLEAATELRNVYDGDEEGQR